MTTRTQRALAVAIVAVLAVALANCTRSSSPEAGRLTVDGQADVTRPGEDRREVTGTRDLEVGDRVRVREGSAVIQLPDDRRLELRVGSEVEMQSAQGGDRVRPALMAGDLLVVSDDEPLAVGATGADVAVHGDARVSRGVALLVAVYEGSAQLAAGGSSLTVPALRQASLPPAGQFPSRVSPLEAAPGDGWDQRYLSDALELGAQLDARSQGFSAQLGPTEGRSFQYFRDLFPRLAAEPGFTAALVNPARLPGETLVGAAISLEGARGTFAERWAAVFGFRDQGASWGLVALDQGVSRVPLLEAVESAVTRGPAGFAKGPPGRPPTSVAPPSRGGSPATTAPSRTTPTTAAPGSSRSGGPASPTTTPTTAPPPPPSPSGPPIPTGPLNTGSPLIDETVNSLVNTLTGLLNSLGQQ